MKKSITLLLIITILLSSFYVSFASSVNITDTLGNTLDRILGNSVDNIKAVTEMLAELIKYTVSKFTDVKSTDWYIDAVSKLVGLKGIDGYDDGTFKPNNQISKAEFVKIVVSSLGYEEGSSSNGHWAKNYIRKGKELNLLDSNEFPDSNLNTAITRNEMAKVVARTLDYLGESHVVERDSYSYQIKDYNNIPSKYKDFVLKAYTKGIINGYPDGSFGGDKGLTRAEASTIIVRILDSSERMVPPAPKKDDVTKTTKITNDDISRLQSYPLNPMYYVDVEDALKSYKGFDEYYRTNKSNAELAVELFTPQKYTPSELKGISFGWFTSPNLVYQTAGRYYGIRGVAQKYLDGKVYEADYEIIINSNTDGISIEDEYSGRLSNWKEVR